VWVHIFDGLLFANVDVLEHLKNLGRDLANLGFCERSGLAQQVDMGLADVVGEEVDVGVVSVDASHLDGSRVVKFGHVCDVLHALVSLHFRSSLHNFHHADALGRLLQSQNTFHVLMTLGHCLHDVVAFIELGSVADLREVREVHH